MEPALTEIGLAVKRLQYRHQRNSDAALAPLGLSIVQWDALRHLHENLDASLHDLAVLTFQTDQSMGALATRMIARGLIERIDGPGRAVRHRLTERGDHLRVEAGSRVGTVLADSFSALTHDQLQTFVDLLQTLIPEARLGAQPVMVDAAGSTRVQR